MTDDDICFAAGEFPQLCGIVSDIQIKQDYISHAYDRIADSKNAIVEKRVFLRQELKKLLSTKRVGMMRYIRAMTGCPCNEAGLCNKYDDASKPPVIEMTYDVLEKLILAIDDLPVGAAREDMNEFIRKVSE